MKRIIVTPEAELDSAEAYDWYERRRIGLGEAFLGAVREGLERAATSPESFPLLERDVRRCLLRTFPYAVLFRVQPDAIVVVAVFHAKRDPSAWRVRQ